ncbi:MAG TPA: PEGA domain-containing protein [Vicinamibacterales bacterium]|nr:PEGA domain-containing protein [Vicinamibacterales bacterium]
MHQIGSGVLGPVFRTFDPQQEKLVAVKVFRLDVVPETSARLADILKRMAAAPVKHPAVVGIIDAGLEGTAAFLAMEYVAAETLDVSLRRLAPANLETAVPMLRQVAEALEAGWSAGMGHGSLHPRDIFVVPPTTEPPHGITVMRVSGFGVTDALEELRIPTPVRRPYTAPERQHDGEWDIRADVYSLGVIAHELLTGRRPTDSLELDAELPEDTSPDQRTAIRRALSGALAADPDQRFATPMAFVDAFTNEAVSTTPAAMPDAPVLPWPVEPEHEAEPDEPNPMAFEEPFDAERFDEERAGEPEGRSIWIPGPERDPEPEPERELARSTPAPAFLGVPSQPDRRELFQPSIDAPRENGMSRIVGVAAIALAMGFGLGYWWRGPAPAASPVEMKSAPETTTSPPSVTKVPEEPIGTDVAVNDPSKAAPSRTPARTPPPAATAVAEPVATRGRLLVRSVPGGGAVTINGRGSGSTPATIRDLPFGTYTVAVSRSGYQRREQRVTISKSVPAKEVTLELVEASAAARAGSSPGRSAGAGVTTGSVLVETRPIGAVVSIDGRSVGTAPVRVPELAPGSHTVRVSLAGHKPVTTTAVVRAGQQTVVRLSLEIQ